MRTDQEEGRESEQKSEENAGGFERGCISACDGYQCREAHCGKSDDADGCGRAKGSLTRVDDQHLTVSFDAITVRHAWISGSKVQSMIAYYGTIL
jgi:hypothetical protein